MSDNISHIVIEFDPETIEFDYLKENGFDTKIEPMPGFIKIWHGQLTSEECDELSEKSWVRALGEAEGIQFED